MNNNIEIIGKMNCYRGKFELHTGKYPDFTALILKEKSSYKDFGERYETEIYYIVSSPFYTKVDEKRFILYISLKEYYENKKEEGWIIEWKEVRPDEDMDK